jgi:hypothetical protein
MGIFIKLDTVPANISKKSWDLAYKEAAQLIQAYPFLDIVSDRASYDCVWNYADRPEERRIPYCNNQIGFRLCGDLVTMETAESFELIKNLGYYNDRGSNNSCKDALEIYGENTQEIVAVFDGKTQGYDYHKYILAITCLFESRLTPYAIVSGDISRGQMEDAIAWANGILERPIQISDRANNQLLLARIKKITADGLASLRMFMEATLNEKDHYLGKFIKMSFHKQTIINYYTERIESCKIGTFGFLDVISEYLDLGNDLEDLCSICITKTTTTEDIKWFIRKILSLNLHVEADNQDKYNQKYVDEQLSFQADKPASKTPDTVGSLFAKIFLKMETGNQRQPSIYIPLDKIRQVFKEKFSDFNNMDGFIDDYLAKMRSPEEAPAKNLPDLPLFENQLSSTTSIEKYDIETLHELILWQPGFTIRPQLEEFILQLKAFIEKDLTEFMEPLKRLKEKEHRMEYLIRCNQYFYLSKKSWDYIAQQLDDLNVFARLAKIMSIKASEVNINRLCLSLLNNVMLFEKFLKSSSSDLVISKI